MARLFSQMERLVRHDETISLMNVGQLWGHSCLRIDTKTRLSLLINIRFDLRLSSDVEAWMMKLTTKLRMPANHSVLMKVHYAMSSNHLGTVLVAEPSTAS